MENKKQTTHIVVKIETRNKLNLLKAEKNYTSIDELIKALIKITQE